MHTSSVRAEMTVYDKSITLLLSGSVPVGGLVVSNSGLVVQAGNIDVASTSEGAK